MVNHAGYRGARYRPARRHFKLAADSLGVRPHVSEAAAPLGVIVGQADAVVRYGHSKAVRLAVQRDGNPIGTGMPKRVGHRVVGHGEEQPPGDPGKRRLSAQLHQLGGDRGNGGERRGVGPQGPGQVTALEDEVTVRVSDGRYYGSLDVMVTVEAVNEAPEFRSGSTHTFTYQENGTSDLYTYRATDPEGNDVTWGLSGDDSGAFTISETGVLTFSNSPDYESPTDSGGNNVYEVTVEARDGDGNTARLEVAVTVTNLTD